MALINGTQNQELTSPVSSMYNAMLATKVKKLPKLEIASMRIMLYSRDGVLRKESNRLFIMSLCILSLWIFYL
jgi:hypothetical protein